MTGACSRGGSRDREQGQVAEIAEQEQGSSTAQLVQTVPGTVLVQGQMVQYRLVDRVQV